MALVIVVHADTPPPPPANPPVPAAPPMAFTASLSPSPLQGYAPLAVSLTAQETGGVPGEVISYLFYCNRSDAVLSVTNPVDFTATGTTPSSYTVPGVCKYMTPGTYSPKVIIEQGNIPVAQAQASVTVTYPPTLGGGGGVGNGGNGGGYVGPPTPAPPPVTQPPIITNVSISQPASSSVIITVQTNKPASIYLKWGKTTTYGSMTNASPYLTTIYEELLNLTPATAYDFMIIAVPQGSSTVSTSPNYVFVTAPGTAVSLNRVETSTQIFFPRNISLNMTGADVLSLTTILGNLGYGIAPISTFTAQASHALLLFQRDHNVNESGYLDFQSQVLMEKIVMGNPVLLQPNQNPVRVSVGSPSSLPVAPTTNSGGITFVENLYFGSRGEQVTTLQNFLTKNADYTGPITGYFGPLTRAGVMAFQAKYGIVNYGDAMTTGYGVVGPKTREKLNQL